jgi:asparagine synthetase B (glutamine-hydrolysing)
VSLSGLRCALRRAEGITESLTGDAADELFAGYSYIFNLPSEQVRQYLDFLNGVMRFSSAPMGASLGVIAQLPYLDPSVRDVALTMSRDGLVGERDGQRFGKKILREADFAARTDHLASEDSDRIWLRQHHASRVRHQLHFRYGVPEREETDSSRTRNHTSRQGAIFLLADLSDTFSSSM